MPKNIYLKDINRRKAFTGDTTCTMDWQIGFENPVCTEGNFNFLGIGEGKAEDKEISKKYEEWKTFFGVPSNCEQVYSNIARIRSLIDTKAYESTQKVKQKRNQGLMVLSSVTGVVLPGAIAKDLSTKNIDAARDVAALNKVLDEYTTYYNLNCITDQSGDVAGTVKEIQPSADPGVPADSAKDGSGGIGATASGLMDKLNLEKNWPWYAGGVGLLIVVIALSGD